MPTKKKKVSPSKAVKKTKPVKASKPAKKGVKNPAKKKPEKPVKASKPVTKKLPAGKAGKITAKKSSNPKGKSAKKTELKKAGPVKTTGKGTAKIVAKKALKVKGKSPANPAKKESKVSTVKKTSRPGVTKSAKPKVATKKPAPIATTKKPAKELNSKKTEIKSKSDQPKIVGPKLDGHKLDGKETKSVKPDPKPLDKKAPDNEKIRKASDPFAKKNYADRSISDVLAISNTIPVKQKNEISASKIALISNSITNPIKKTDSYAVKPDKEPNGKFELEFVIHSSAEMLYEFLSTPSGLSEWFCDDLNIRNGIYTFIWDDQLQQARLLKTVDVHLVRFQWVDKTDGSYFEFRIQRDDLTNDISLIITDFAETAGDRESSKLLWHSQVEKLMHVIGSIF